MTDSESSGLQPERRPIASRSSGWAQALSRKLAQSSVTPNQISVWSVVCAGIGAGLMLGYAHPAAWIGAALCIQLRLVCNLLDGMVAIEGGKKSPVGAIYNEFPDRIADSLFLVAAGYAAAWPALGWLSALLAALTAYVRVFGGSLGLPQSFGGLMAKQHRMAVLTAALVAQSVLWFFSPSPLALQIAIAVIAVGSAWTCMTRTKDIAARLKTS
ncbi:CDP-alcohol phosphatidyltransferase family protein [Corticibacterium sp. UT-5YL-CI-8]|nr:CDP-alcohol phosphatidyltransferase family protein [Tianweitania sp. UT-5YL-CI-8]